MDSFYLAQLFGLYFIIIGVAALVQQKSLIPAVSEFLKNRALMLVVALLEIAAGLALILSHPQITADMEGALSLIGWVMLAEGVVYLLLPRKDIQSVMRSFNTRFWYAAGGVAAILIGAYLAAAGFQILM